MFHKTGKNPLSTTCTELVVILQRFPQHYNLMLTKKFVVYLLLHRTELIKVQQIRPGGGGVTWVNFCWVCAADLSEPIPR